MSITITQPDDWHLHVRDHAYLAATVPATSRCFARAIIMPNTVPPIVNITMARDYQQRILQHIPETDSFTPLMTLYLTPDTTPELVEQAKSSGFIHGIKLYPARATTHSQWGVENLTQVYPVLAAMEKFDLPLLIHGEVTDPAVDIFDRESFFITQHLMPLLKHFPQLRVVLEHITTSDAVDFISEAPAHVAATITAHHLLYDRNALFAGGIHPHLYCLPILKRHIHQQALLKAATSGNPHFFLGTDSAPHTQSNKESACGCAGIFTAHAAIELYAEAFDHMNALDKLEGFASFYGADFYGLPRNTKTITLVKNPWEVPHQIAFGDQALIPLRAGEMIEWRRVD